MLYLFILSSHLKDCFGLVFCFLNWITFYNSIILIQPYTPEPPSSHLRADHLTIKKSVFQFLAPLVCMSKRQ